MKNFSIEYKVNIHNTNHLQYLYNKTGYSLDEFTQFGHKTTGAYGNIIEYKNWKLEQVQGGEPGDYWLSRKKYKLTSFAKGLIIFIIGFILGWLI